MIQLDVEKFVSLEGQALQPVPEDERDFYTYWRAAHLGSIALNFTCGNHSLNARGVGYAHFWAHYDWAINTARELSNGFRLTQFDSDHHQQLVNTLGIPETFAYPSLILALDPVNNQLAEKIKVIDSLNAPLEELFSPEVFSQPFSPGGGHIIRGPLTLDMVDSHSRQAIQELFVGSE